MVEVDGEEMSEDEQEAPDDGTQPSANQNQPDRPN